MATYREFIVESINEKFDEITEELERIKRRVPDKGYPRKNIEQDLEDLLDKLM